MKVEARFHLNTDEINEAIRCYVEKKIDNFFIHNSYDINIYVNPFGDSRIR